MIVAKYQSWSSYTYEDAVKMFESTDYSTFCSEGNWYQLAIAMTDSDELVGDYGQYIL